MRSRRCAAGRRRACCARHTRTCSIRSATWPHASRLCRPSTTQQLIHPRDTPHTSLVSTAILLRPFCQRVGRFEALTPHRPFGIFGAPHGVADRYSRPRISWANCDRQSGTVRRGILLRAHISSAASTLQPFTKRFATMDAYSLPYLPLSCFGSSWPLSHVARLCLSALWRGLPRCTTH